MRMLGYPHRVLEWEQRDGHSFMLPNQDFVDKWYDNLPPVRVQINSNGLRDNELIYKDGFKILILGDSFTYGSGVRLEDTYVDILEKKLRRSRPQTEVINAGHIAVSVDTEYELLIGMGLALKPDIVLLQFYKNDIDECFNASYYKKLYAAWPIPFKRYLRRTAVYIQLLKIKPYLAKIGKKDVKKNEISASAVDEFYKENLSLDAQKAWELYLDKLKQVVKICKENHIRFILLIIPEEYQVQNSQLASMPQIMLNKFAQDNDISVIDPLITLRRRFLKGIKDYIPNDGHLSVEGNKIIAQIIYDTLAKHERGFVLKR